MVMRGGEGRGRGKDFFMLTLFFHHGLKSVCKTKRSKIIIMTIMGQKISNLYSKITCSVYLPKSPLVTFHWNLI